MVSVFVSHSKSDGHLVAYFSKIFANIGLRAKFMEWETLEDKYAGYEIGRIIRAGFLSGHDTAAVFVLLGSSLQNPPSSTPEYTHNWVNFEVGVAAGSQKPVWVFEEFTEFIRFPIPFVTDYVQYTLEDTQHLRYLSDLFRSRILNPSQNRVPKDVQLRCPYKDCNAHYNYWSKADRIFCPVCRREISFSSNENPSPPKDPFSPFSTPWS